MEQSDDEDFSSFVAARWASLVRVGVYLGCSTAEAEDVVQTALLQCYRVWPRVRHADNTDAYVHRVLVNTLTKARRRHWRLETPTAELPDTQANEFATDSDARDDLLRVLRRLPFDQQTVLVLRYIGDLTEQQTAEVLKLPLGTVKSRASRALATIDRQDLVEELP